MRTEAVFTPEMNQEKQISIHQLIMNAALILHTYQIKTLSRLVSDSGLNCELLTRLPTILFQCFHPLPATTRMVVSQQLMTVDQPV